MKLRRSLRLNSLKRVRIRQSWNKYNLYNLCNYKTKEHVFELRTFFQQKWTAKALTRGYHGEHIREKKWERMFSRRLDSAVDMDPQYMAEHDGSEQATGRGSGKAQDPSAGKPAPTNFRRSARTPFMQMTYAPMERRLDIAIFRALFASSPRQARQFVLHGRVKVNGKKMTYPGYLLNPGDMFQVDPEIVMMATGKPKGNLTELQKKQGKKGDYQPKEESSEAEPEDAGEAQAAGADAADEKAAAEPRDPEAEAEAEAAALKQKKNDLKALLASAKAILEDKDIGVKRKQKIRAFTQEVKKAIAKAGQKSATSDAVAIEELSDMLKTLSVAPAPNKAAEAAAAQSQSAETAGDGEPSSEGSAASSGGNDQQLTPQERARFEELLKEYRENPIDESKPYRTPWEPRPWMAPFAFIPRYLEVNQNICSAVYLRHPVARQGYAEVPTPFSEFVGQLSFNWYLRRR